MSAVCLLMNSCQGRCLMLGKIMTKTRHSLMGCYGPSVSLSESHLLTLWTLTWVSVAVKPLGKQRVIGWSPDQMGLVLFFLPFLSHYQFYYSFYAPPPHFLLFLCVYACVWIHVLLCEFMSGPKVDNKTFLQSFSIFNFLVLIFLRQGPSDLGLKLTLTGEHLGHAGLDLHPSSGFQVW